MRLGFLSCGSLTVLEPYSVGAVANCGGQEAVGLIAFSQCALLILGRGKLRRETELLQRDRNQ